MQSTSSSTGPIPKRQRTRDRLAQVAFELFETHGYDAVTMDQIATAAEVARGTLYNHFAVKEAVLAYWMHAQLARDLTPLMEAAMRQASFNGRVGTVLMASAGWWEAHRRYLAPYVRYRFQRVGREPPADRGRPTSDMVTVYASLIEQGQKSGELRQDASVAQLALYLHYLTLCALMRWLADPDLSLAEEFADVVAFFHQGAMARVP
ncbi:TetR/AcrR family transcriptional regulator [Montanilutibacter psychrotolerans]|uniref:TetR/AcrR family transcriptional regulator n=1 Tax=Montanilutibacter psychrotolerans TaxID=1327343 RepID=A0A3M8SUU9_9GAMM|nr:TetR/AcrR family transcriptional regulator [Lysobacter psychrotolerans]RNF84475.1 TetR/AcrR family transcriptional regulator [Lysobacter psychrotolerans]